MCRKQIEDECILSKAPTFILIMLILPPNDKGSKFQCFKSCLSWVKSGEKLALNVSWKTRVIQIPKY